jgi:hypothetical protein
MKVVMRERSSLGAAASVMVPALLGTEGNPWAGHEVGIREIPDPFSMIARSCPSPSTGTLVDYLGVVTLDKDASRATPEGLDIAEIGDPHPVGIGKNAIGQKTQGDEIAKVDQAAINDERVLVEIRRHDVSDVDTEPIASHGTPR